MTASVFKILFLFIPTQQDQNVERVAPLVSSNMVVIRTKVLDLELL